MKRENYATDRVEEGGYVTKKGANSLCRFKQIDRVKEGAEKGEDKHALSFSLVCDLVTMSCKSGRRMNCKTVVNC